MRGFIGGMIMGGLIGVVVTLLALIIVAGARGPENAPAGQIPNRKVFLAALGLLAICGVCYTPDWKRALCWRFCSQFC